MKEREYFVGIDPASIRPDGDWGAVAMAYIDEKGELVMVPFPLEEKPNPDPLEKFGLIVAACLISCLLIFICWLLLFSVSFPIS